MIKFHSEGGGAGQAVSVGNKALLGELESGYLAADAATQVLASTSRASVPTRGGHSSSRQGTAASRWWSSRQARVRAEARPSPATTASLAGIRHFSAVLAQHGIFEAASELEFVSFCEGLGNTAVDPGAGGDHPVAADTAPWRPNACAAHGIAVPTLPESRQEALRQRLRPSVRAIASLDNPWISRAAPWRGFRRRRADPLESEEIDCVRPPCCFPTSGDHLRPGGKVGSVARQAGKPLDRYVSP
jgi:hypothetical protein